MAIFSFATKTLRLKGAQSVRTNLSNSHRKIFFSCLPSYCFLSSCLCGNIFFRTKTLRLKGAQSVRTNLSISHRKIFSLAFLRVASCLSVFVAIFSFATKTLRLKGAKSVRTNLSISHRKIFFSYLPSIKSVKNKYFSLPFTFPRAVI